MGIEGPVVQVTPSVRFGRVKHAGVAVMAVLLCAATLSVGDSGGAVAASGPARPSPGAAFAQRVLDDAVVPPGARVTTVVRSRTLKGNFVTTGLPGTRDVHRLYLLDESMDAVESYLKAHVPKDATQLGYGSDDYPSGVSLLSLWYDLPVSGPHDYLAELSYLSVDTGSGAELRVDAEVVWEPNRPADERAPGNGVVEVTAYSKASLRSGSSGPVTVTVTGARARALLGALNALPLGPRQSCMEDSLLFKLVVRRGGLAAGVGGRWLGLHGGRGRERTRPRHAGPCRPELCSAARRRQRPPRPRGERHSRRGKRVRSARSPEGRFGNPARGARQVDQGRAPDGEGQR